jgi:transitional endoplasmic reticulum ATPase
MKKKHGIFQKRDYINAIYQVDFYLGENDACEIYRVFDAKNELKLLKLIKPDLVSNIDLKKIAIELKRFSSLCHPNIISNSELSSFQIKENTYYYYVLDFISGESLEYLLNRCLTIDIKKSCDIVLNIIKAVLFLHDLDEPYIFGNITPNSVFINYEDNGEKALIIPVLVSNFLFDDNKNHQQKISYAYQANAVLSGEVSIVDDVYAVVTLLYKIITGVFPWNYDFDWEVSGHQFIKNRITLHREIYPLTKISHYIDFAPKEFESIFLKGLDNHSADKYLNINELEQDLNKFVQEKYSFIKSNKVEKTHEESNVLNSVNEDKKNTGLSKVIGMLDIKELLKNDVIKPLQETDAYKKYGIQPLNGILLYGPAGCGKTYIAKNLAEELGFYYIEIKPSDLASTYIHGTQEKIGKLFQKAEANAPTLIFIDEVDAILPRRDLDNLSPHYAAEVNEFLAQMTDCMSRRIFIIAATNRPEIIEPAILRTGRLDKSIYIGLPDFNTRMSVLKFELQNRPCEKDLDIYHLAMMTTCYALSDLKFLVNEAAKLALYNSELINGEYFKTAINKYPSSVSQDQIEKYEQFKSKA